MDEKGAAMKRLLLLGFAFFVTAAHAHVGSPDVFYEGMVGPYPARINIRMPTVVPGRAEISVRVQSEKPVETSFLPLYAWTAISNAPPPDVGRLVTGETNLYSGELWLMSFGAYSVEVRIKGDSGEGVARIPVTSVALRQLPMPSLLGKVLLALAGVLVLGAIGIAAAAGREAALAPGAIAGKREWRNGFFAAGTAFLLGSVALVGGKSWWGAEEKSFRRHLREGAWPDLSADVRMAGPERILRLEVGKQFFQENKPFLIPDHGKLMHLFLIREGNRDGFAHLHPIRKEDYTFEVAIPSLPEGRYSIFADLTFEGGVSSTATNSVFLPAAVVALKNQSSPTNSSDLPARDVDDSWAASMAPASGSSTAIYHLADGAQITWHSQKNLRAKQDASLRFTLTDSAGQPLPLEPYMGMLCHAAVLRSDGSVFAHLHPSGNFSMAAQTYFEKKLMKETAPQTEDSPTVTTHDHSMHHMHSASSSSSVYLPYEFPEPGNYRIWVQFKTSDGVVTGVFDAQVGS